MGVGRAIYGLGFRVQGVGLGSLFDRRVSSKAVGLDLRHD